MKVINRTYKYRLYPTREQEQVLSQHFGCVRFVYNRFLAERKRQYDETGTSDNYNKQAAALTMLKAEEEYSWLRDINSQSLQHALRHLETAYVNFFRGNAKFPKFKSRKARNSFTVPQHITMEDGRIKFPKFREGIKLKEHRPFKDLSVRRWTCPECGAEHDRDINASINILAEGLKSVSSGTGDYKGGDRVRLARKQRSAKPEAQSSLAVG